MSTYAAILALLLSVPAYAVDTLQVTTPDPVLEQWRWTSFDRASSLAGGVRDIYEDRDGSIWFATIRGVHRYDGYRWTTYTTKDGLAHDHVRTVIQTRDGAMWFGTNGGGISRFDASVEPVTSPSASLDEANSVEGIRRKAWTTYTEEDGLGTNYLDALLEARDGTLWAGLHSPGDTTDAKGGVARFDPSTPLRGGGKTWTMVDLPGQVPRPRARAIRQSTGGDVWVATQKGAFRFDGLRWTHYTVEDGLARNSVRGILESRDGAIWLACGRGISRFDPSLSLQRGGGEWRTYTTQEGLPENSWIHSIWQTQDGTIWAGGWGEPGLCRFDGKQWRAYSREDVPQLGGGLMGKTMRDGTVWIGIWGRGEALRFDPNETRWTVFPDIRATRNNTSVGDEVWLGAEDGAVRFDGKVWTKFTADDGSISGPVSAILRDKDGSLWIAGQHEGRSGAARFDGETWRIYTETDGADEVAPDGVNEVLFADLSDAGVIAVTITWGIFSGPPPGRELIEWDLVFEDPDFVWGNADVDSTVSDGPSEHRNPRGGTRGWTRSPA